MITAENFILTSDFATLKNDAKTTLSITLPGSSVVASGSALTLTATATLGVAGAAERIAIHSSKIGLYYSGPIVDLARDGLFGGVSGIYFITAEVYRSSATQVTATVYIPNNSGSSLTTAAGDETFTFYVSSFITPF